jgi:ATP synthase protein I
MQANDVRVLKSAAIPTLVVGVVAVVVAQLTVGGGGALGAVIGTLLVAVFFSISVVAVSYAARVSPQMMAIAAMVSYLVKVIVIMVMLVTFGDTTLWNPQVFAWSVVVCTIVWTAFEVRAFIKTKMLYVDPEATVPGQGDR